MGFRSMTIKTSTLWNWDMTLTAISVFFTRSSVLTGISIKNTKELSPSLLYGHSLKRLRRENGG